MHAVISWFLCSTTLYVSLALSKRDSIEVHVSLARLTEKKQTPFSLTIINKGSSAIMEDRAQMHIVCPLLFVGVGVAVAE